VLLRLYPSHFRDAYGEAALQLFRDRARDEKGFFPTVRLWLDLLADLAISLPREYRYVPRSWQLPRHSVWAVRLPFSFWKTSRHVPEPFFSEAR
jgi:hypothetical protein